MKIIPLLIVSLFLHDCYVKAQTGVPTQFSKDYNRMMSDRSLDFGSRIGNFSDQNEEVYYNAKFQFTVLMKDSSVRFAKSKIYFDTITHRCYLRYIDKDVSKTDSTREQKIFPDETIMIWRDDNQLNKQVRSFAWDSAWLFKVIE